MHQKSFIIVTTLLRFGFTKPTPATLNKQIEAEPDLNNNQIYYWGIIAVRGGLMFVDFLGYPYPRNNVPTNQQIFAYPQLLGHVNLNDSTVMHFLMTDHHMDPHEKLKYLKQYLSTCSCGVH